MEIDWDRFSGQLIGEAHRVLSFWMRYLPDENAGGFYGRLDHHHLLHPEADKAVILNTRILWAFSMAARHFEEPGYREMAKRAYVYLADYFLDEKQGGLYWMLDHQGRVVDSKKQIYAQAFGIYSLSEYYRLTGDEEARDRAIGLFRLIEQFSYDADRGGYLEAFSRDWQLLDDLRLSEKDANEAKTMNTHLHVLEGYTNLYRIWPDELLRRRLRELIGCFLDFIVDLQGGHLHLFFDEDWQVKSEEISFGHDIEAAWLLGEATELLQEADLRKRVEEAACRIAEHTLREGVDADGGLWNEAGPQGVTDTDKSWWPQAEAMVGFLYGFQLTRDPKFARAAVNSWAFIDRFLIDRVRGEWRWRVDRHGQPTGNDNVAGPWKAPYHNTRACVEGASRICKLEM